jgi:hypothetical protein
MVALTYGDARVGTVDSAPTTKTAAPAAPRKAWYVRLVDAIIEARMQQARREIRMYTATMPYIIDENGNRKLKTEMNAPAGGW